MLRGLLTKSRTALQSGAKPLVGHWHMSGSPLLAETVTSAAEYDVLVVDCQHGAIDVGGAAAVMASVRNAAPWVRLRDTAPSHIHHVLDAGAVGIIAPLINSVEDAEAFVRESNYPPAGTRSFGPFRAGLLEPGYFDAANGGIMRWAMIETAAAFEAKAEIAAVPGIDGLFVGPNDLALALGFTPPTSNPTDAVVLAAIQSTRDAAHAAGKYAGIFCGGGSFAGSFAAKRFDLVIAGTDLGLLQAAACKELAAARGGGDGGGGGARSGY